MSGRNTRRGSALIEFAGSLFLWSVVLAGLFQIGYTFYTYNTLVNAVRAGYAFVPTSQPSREPIQRQLKRCEIWWCMGIPRPARVLVRWRRA